MSAPAWLLLIWSGLGASCAAAVAATLVGGVESASWSLAPRPRSRSHGLAWTVLAGAAVYPVLYGAIFEVTGRADLRLGIVAGAVHGILAALLARPRSAPHAAARTGVAHLVYGAVIAFLYVTP